MLGHAFFQGSHQGCGPDVAHLGTVGNELDLFGALDHAQRHAGRADINKLDLRQRRFQHIEPVHWQVVKLDADPAFVRDAGLHSAKIIAPLPVGIGQHVIGNPLAPGLRAVDVGGNQGGLVMRDCQAVKTAEGAKEKVAVIVDVVVGGEQHRIELTALHELAHFGHALGVFLG